MYMFIKNTTPYVGKIKLKFEKFPEYTGGGSKLNKVHLNLGFTKLVSRIYPNQLKEGGWQVDLEKVKLIKLFTGGNIGTYSVPSFANLDEEDCKLRNSFLSQDGTYIGDIERGWWYYENSLRVSDEYPRGVAEVLDDTFKLAVVGYHGYTHRGGQTFKIGDKLFDANYEPKEEDYEPWEWAGFVQRYEKALEEGDEFDRKWTEAAGIASVIPYKKRGIKEIETLEECLQAAVNMRNDLS